MPSRLRAIVRRALPSVAAAQFPALVQLAALFQLAALVQLAEPAELAAQDAPADLLIINGRIVDGTGAAWFYGDLVIRGDRIARIAPRGVLTGIVARDTIDATGMVVAPGFIDIQGQSNFALLYGDSRLVSKVSQGITSEILGEGSTPAPLNARNLAANANAQQQRFAEPHGFGNWLADIETRTMSVNIGSFVGGSTIRAYGMRARAGAADSAALAEMRGALERAMQDGAFGMATALIYPPGVFANTAELTAVSQAMRPYGGLYVTHMRSEGDQLLEAVDEAIAIGRDAGVPVEIYHLKAGGRRNWPKGPESIARIAAARAQGLDVQANVYPYTAGGTGLTSCLPPAAQEDNRLFQRLADPAERARIRAEIERPTSAWENLCELGGIDNVLIARLSVDSLRRYGGQRLSQIAAARGTDWIEAAFTLIAAERSRVETIYFLMSEENVALNLQQPWIKIGTDAGGVTPSANAGLVHPRSYGTFPRILGRYVRDEQVIPLEDAIRKMTSATARRLGIANRGVLAEGMMADVVVFDPATVGDRATFEQPHQLSVGVTATIVNGVPVWRGGAHTGAKPGQILRGPGATDGSARH
ncbi:MAG: D-aminoacylase [Gemmatimonadaceae bacterium]|nr:D-aminoacylase [Gemmatimonadaceae bacterium]